MTVPNWLELVKLTGEAIDWLDNHEKVYDVWFLIAYSATSCALVQVRLVFWIGFSISLMCPTDFSIIHVQDACKRMKHLLSCVSSETV
jgi:hypothetical protein